MRNNILGKLIFLQLILFIYTPAGYAVKSPFSFLGTVDFFLDDNVGKAQNNNDIYEDTGTVFTGSVNYARGIDRLSAFLANSSIAFEEYSDFDGLSNTKISASASYVFQRSIGFSSPSYRIFFEVNNIDSETDIRDRTGINIGAELKRRLTDKLRLNLGTTFTSEDATGDTFDVNRVRLFANLDLQHTARTAFYSTFSWINEDITSTATANQTYALPFINSAAAIEFDNAFGGTETGQAAYRLDDATTIVLSIGSNIGIDNKSSIDISLDTVTSSADADIEYDRTIMRAVYLTRF